MGDLLGFVCSCPHFTYTDDEYLRLLWQSSEVACHPTSPCTTHTPKIWSKLGVWVFGIPRSLHLHEMNIISSPFMVLLHHTSRQGLIEFNGPSQRHLARTLIEFPCSPHPFPRRTPYFFFPRFDPQKRIKIFSGSRATGGGIEKKIAN